LPADNDPIMNARVENENEEYDLINLNSEEEVANQDNAGENPL